MISSEHPCDRKTHISERPAQLGCGEGPARSLRWWSAGCRQRWGIKNGKVDLWNSDGFCLSGQRSSVETLKIWSEVECWFENLLNHLSPDDMAGVPCSIADTTTGREPWIRKPNSPPTLRFSSYLFKISVERKLKNWATLWDWLLYISFSSERKVPTFELARSCCIQKFVQESDCT